MRTFYTRIHPRWKRYDYRLPGIYFVTAVTLDRARLFGVLRRGECVLSPLGVIVRDAWRCIPERFPGVELDAFVVMPDHVHALLVLPESASNSLSEIVGWAKSRSAHGINVMRGTGGSRIWQTSFHDSIVRTARGRDRVRQYIESNPRPTRPTYRRGRRTGAGDRPTGLRRWPDTTIECDDPTMQERWRGNDVMAVCVPPTAPPVRPAPAIPSTCRRTR